MTRELAGQRFQPTDRDIEDALGERSEGSERMGVYYFNTDQYEEAIECWLKISEIDAGFPAVHFTWGAHFCAWVSFRGAPGVRSPLSGIPAIPKSRIRRPSPESPGPKR
jgi:hypothetical protein